MTQRQQCKTDSAVQPTIVVDSREQSPLAFRSLPSVVATLQWGDYSFVGGEELFAVERKSIADLVACCIGSNRERFERALHRLRGFRFKRLLIVGNRVEIEQHRYRSGVSPKAVMSTLAAFEVRYDLPVVWSNTPDDGAVLIERWAWWFCRELLKSAESVFTADKNTKTGTSAVAKAISSITMESKENQAASPTECDATNGKSCT